MAANGVGSKNDGVAAADSSKAAKKADSPQISPTQSHRSSSSLSFPSTTSNSTKEHHHSHNVLGSLFTRGEHHHNNVVGRDSALGHMLAPALQVAGAHNPFTINALYEDGTRKKGSHKQEKELASSSSGTNYASVDDDETIASDSYKRRPRTRDRIRSAFGRSLSPWRYHNEQDKRRGSSASNLSRQSRDSLDVQREKTAKGREEGEGGESDGESVRSGIVPRNSAFGSFDSDSEDEMDAPPHHHDRHHHTRPASSDAEVVPSEEATKDSDAQQETSEGGEADEDSDDYIDFDEETLDNTLFNAGCIDLHDAWMKDDYRPSSRPTSEGGTAHDEKLQPTAHTHTHYGPDDYDAAWDGAGPSGHDEHDEGLRAPNVVIGQSKSMSPSELVGDGMEILSISEGLSNHAPPTSVLSRATSVPSPVSTSQSLEKTSTTDSTTTKVSQKSSSSISSNQRLTASRPVFEKNRCTITLVHGDYDRLSKESKRPRRYIVASDGSEESSYAIEWTIGTVLRDGDEMLVVSVMETDTKLDSSDSKHEDKRARQEHQRIRQSMAVILARRAVAVLQRTRLAVRVSCQALHARNSRHMFIDMIDFFEPTMCVVGSRGLGSLKGVLLGSFSHYCVQKSPVPVMVARKRLKLPPLPKGKVDVVSNVRARHMRLDQAMIEKEPNIAEEKPDAEAEKKKEFEGEEDGEKEQSKKEEEEREKGEMHANAEERSAEDAGRASNEQEDDRKGEREKEQRKEEEEEKDAIKRDAEQATELQEKERAAAAKKQAKLEKEAEASAKEAKEEGGSSASSNTRGRKKFSVGDEEGEGEETRGRSRSRTSDRQ